MSQKVRFKITLRHAGESGVPIAQLGKVSEETGRFLKMLADDLRVDVGVDDLLATKPKSGSFAFDVETTKKLSTKQTRSLRSGVSRMARYRPGRSKPPANLRRETILQFAKIGIGLSGDESVEFGVYEDSRVPKSVGDMSKDKARLIVAAFDETISQYGSAQGSIHSLNKGSDPAYFMLRELSTSSLIRCEFKPERYDDVVALLRKMTAIILVSGPMEMSREQQSVVKIDVEDLAEPEEISIEEFEAFFGSAPQMTGEKSTEEFIDWVRSDE